MYNDKKLEEEIAAIDLAGPEPGDEHSRELYYIGRLRNLIAEKSAAAGRKLTACTVTFGCQMNARDSEKLTGILIQSGFEPTESEKADFVIFNTCTVRDNTSGQDQPSQKTEPADEGRGMRLHDAGELQCGKDQKELPLC